MSTVYVFGVSAFGRVGNALVWGVIVPGQTPGYNPLTPGTSAAYSNVVPNQAPSYVGVVPATSTGYSDVTPAQNPVWSPTTV